MMTQATMRPALLTRMSAVAAVAALLALTGPASPAAADDSGLLGMPPPVDDSARPPAATPTPDPSYQRKSNCVQVASSQATLPKPWGQKDLRIEEAQRFATGKGQRIAVIDTGVAQNDALARLSGGGDYVANDNGLADCDGHGTAVAGIIAAKASDGGFTGVAPDASIISIRQGSSYYSAGQGAEGVGNVLTLAKAIRTAVDKGVTAMNVSISACFAPSVDAGTDSSQKALQAAVHYAKEKDVVVVVAAGNVDPNKGTCTQQNSSDPRAPLNIISSPAWYHGDVLTVAAMGDGVPASFSIAGPWVDVAAPGTNIISLAPASSGLTNSVADSPGTQPGPIQGTSFAAPYVTGLVALIRERFPNLNATQVMDRIKKTAQHPGGSGGRNNVVGYGMINPVAALTAVIPEEAGIAPATPAPLRTDLAARPDKNATAVQAALIGSGVGIGLVGLTLFVLHTVQRARARATQFAARTPRARL